VASDSAFYRRERAFGYFLLGQSRADADLERVRPKSDDAVLVVASVLGRFTGYHCVGVWCHGMGSSPVNSAFFPSVRGLIERGAHPYAFLGGDFGRGDLVADMGWTPVACGPLFGLSHGSVDCGNVDSHRIAGGWSKAIGGVNG
jgi:hypothetical protein